MGRGGVSVLVGLTLVLAGCSGSTSEQPKVLPPVVTPSASPSAASTASAGPVVVPSAAVPATPQGAAAFVRFFYGELNGALQDGNARRIRILADPRCGTCSDYANTIEAAAKLQYHIVGSSFASLQVAATRTETGLVLVSVFGTIPKRQASDKGRLTTLIADGNFQNTVAIERHIDHWLVRAIRFEKS